MYDHPVWGIHARQLTELNAHSVDSKKVTDHHALLITGKKPIDMFGEEVVVYDMIAGRMLEAFSARCVKDVSTVTAVCEGVKFILKGEFIKEEGWRAIIKTARRKTRNSWKPKNGKVGRMEKASSSPMGGRRTASALCLFAGTRNDQAQAPAHGKFAVGGYGDGR